MNQETKTNEAELGKRQFGVGTSSKNDDLTQIKPKRVGKKRGRKPKKRDYFGRSEYENPVQKLVESQGNGGKNYKSFKFDEKTYTLGDDVLVYNKENFSVPYVAKIDKIKLFKLKTGENVAAIKVKWYLCKYDLSRKYDKYQAYFSDRELFLSDFHEFVSPKTLQGKCIIQTLKQFDKGKDDGITKRFFHRAKYSARTLNLEPAISNWEKHCVCHAPLNPDLHFIFCEKCKKWFHLGCVSINREQADNMGDYTCENCKGKE